jgi:hypothetical protein
VIRLNDPADHPAIAPAPRAAFGECGRRNATLVAGLLRPEMEVEIEVKAFRV